MRKKNAIAKKTSKIVLSKKNIKNPAIPTVNLVTIKNMTLEMIIESIKEITKNIRGKIVETTKIEIIKNIREMADKIIEVVDKEVIELIIEVTIVTTEIIKIEIIENPEKTKIEIIENPEKTKIEKIGTTVITENLDKVGENTKETEKITQKIKGITTERTVVNIKEKTKERIEEVEEKIKNIIVEISIVKIEGIITGNLESLGAS